MKNKYIFYILPFIGSINYALLNSQADGKWVGLGNFITLFNSELFLVAVKNTLMFMFLIVPIIVILSFFLSMMAWGNKGIGSFFRSVMLTTYVLPTVAVMFLWNIFFHRAGTINGVFDLFGMPAVNWLEEIKCVGQLY